MVNHQLTLRKTGIIGFLFLSIFTISACGTTTTESQAQIIMRKVAAAPLHNASFTSQWQTTQQSANGQGTLQIAPRQIDLHLNLKNMTQQSAIEILADENFTYTRIASDTMWAQEGEATPYINPVTLGVNVFDISALRNPVLVGQETIMNIVTWHLRSPLIVPEPNVIGNSNILHGDTDLWVQQGSYFPVKLAQQVNGTSVTGTPVQLSVTYTFSQWNAGVTITPPGPDQIGVSG